MTVARALCQSLVSSSHDYESVCNSLLIIFRHNKQDMGLVGWALQNEIDTCGTCTTRFVPGHTPVHSLCVVVTTHCRGWHDGYAVPRDDGDRKSTRLNSSH